MFSLAYDLQDESIESKVDPIRSISGTPPTCLPGDGERQIFQGAISIRRDDWEQHQPVCDTVVTVYESFARGTQNDLANNDEVRLRAVVYYSKLGAYAEVSITGFQDLRQVMVHLAQIRRDLCYVATPQVPGCWRITIA